MLEALVQARLWLANLDPAAPAVSLMLGVFLTIYSIRRWFPRVWLLVEKTVPFVDRLDYRPAATILWKSWQAWPAALLGAVVSALSTGGSAWGAVKGAALGAAVALIHELAAAYRGKLGAPKLPSASSRSAGLGLVVLACGIAGYQTVSCTSADKAKLKDAADQARRDLNAYCDSRQKLLDGLSAGGSEGRTVGEAGDHQ